MATKLKKKRRSVSRGKAFIRCSYNNTLITFTDEHGDVLAKSSAGACGFKGPKKATPYAASIAAAKACEAVKAYGLQQVEVYVAGVGPGREQSIRGIQANGINVITIADDTPIPHNGCRRPKPRH